MLGLGEIHVAAATVALALVLALLVDRYFGEPSPRWHPVVWMGHYLNWAQRYAAPTAAQPPLLDAAPDWKSFWLGTAFWVAGGAAIFVTSAWVQGFVLQAPALLAAVLLGLLFKPLFAWRMLCDEVLAVELALQSSIVAGRERLAHLVSRDVQQLSASEVRESAIESLAENLNDSVVSPVLWFIVAGLPGAALYRFANTADAMWGYRGERAGRVWEWAGKWAARADDVLSWPGARITALLVIVVVKLRFFRLPNHPVLANFFSLNRFLGKAHAIA